MKSLSKFPKKSANAFCADSYYHDVRQQVAAESAHTGDAALEFEFEGEMLPAAITFADGGIGWVAHADGSLRGGMEYVMTAPAPRDRIRTLADGLFEELHTRGATINNSTRCSTHVHVNMGGLRVNQLCAFVSLYGMVEDVLTAWCGETRVGNLFALRLCDSTAALERWIAAFRTGSFDFSNEQRYLALNPAALKKFGSLEARALRGLTTSGPAVAWCDVLLRLRDVATVGTYENPEEIAIQLSTLGGRGFFDNLFDGLTVREELIEAAAANDISIEHSVREGFRRIQPLIYSVPWSSVLEEIRKPYIPNPFAAPKAKKSRLTDFATAGPRFVGEDEEPDFGN